MPPLLLILILFIEYSSSVIWNQSDSNCSLLFTVQVVNVSDTIATHFPLKLTGYFNTSCDIQNLSAYYKLTPLNVILIGNAEQQDDDTYSMIHLHANRFNFSINQSSTIRMCVLLSNGDDDTRYLCRQIHIGVNELYNFWNSPMKVFYVVSICLLGTYHILRFLRNKWRKSGKTSKSKAKTVVIERRSIHEVKHDTFENEKVNEDMSGDEDEE